jgi:hypothetical protein
VQDAEQERIPAETSRRLYDVVPVVMRPRSSRVQKHRARVVNEKPKVSGEQQLF